MRERKRASVSKIIKAMILSLALVAGTVTSVGNVFAEAPSQELMSNYARLDFNAPQGQTISSFTDVSGGTSVTANYSIGTDHVGTMTITGTGLYSDSENHDVYAPLNSTVTVSVNPEENYTAALWFNGTKQEGTSKTVENVASGTPYNFDGDFSPENQTPDPGETQFDGNAYFVWMSNDKICYHKFTNIPGRSPEGGYEMFYVNVNEITDESGNSGTYTWGQENANWVLAGDMESAQGTVKTDLTKEYIFGDGQFDMGKQLDPCGAVNGANSICTNADRHFRATIIREGYSAVEFSNKPEDYTYYPTFWNKDFYSPDVDISNTTAANPAVYQAYLLEPEIIFKSNGYTGQITGVTPLNVNPNAISVSVADGLVKIKFNSNYYDQTVFELTMSDGNKRYIQIQRVTMKVIGEPVNGTPSAVAEFNFPASTNISNYEVIANIVNKDGTSASQVLSPNTAYQPGMPGEGKGVSVAYFTIPVNRETMSGIYFNVVYKGALTGETFQGTFSGSGKGFYFDLK